jgi:hypothetical protein
MQLSKNHDPCPDCGGQATLAVAALTDFHIGPDRKPTVTRRTHVVVPCGECGASGRIPTKRLF